MVSRYVQAPRVGYHAPFTSFREYVVVYPVTSRLDEGSLDFYLQFISFLGVLPLLKIFMQNDEMNSKSHFEVNLIFSRQELLPNFVVNLGSPGAICVWTRRRSNRSLSGRRDGRPLKYQRKNLLCSPGLNTSVVYKSHMSDMFAAGLTLDLYSFSTRDRNSQ